MTDKLRWKIATLVEKLPRQCWADLVSWVLDTPRMRREKGRLPWRPVKPICFAAGQPRCYCGKYPSPR